MEEQVTALIRSGDSPASWLFFLCVMSSNLASPSPRGITKTTETHASCKQLTPCKLGQLWPPGWVGFGDEFNSL